MPITYNSCSFGNANALNNAKQLNTRIPKSRNSDLKAQKSASGRLLIVPKNSYKLDLVLAGRLLQKVEISYSCLVLTQVFERG